MHNRYLVNWPPQELPGYAAIAVSVLGVVVSEGFLFIDAVVFGLLAHLGTILFITFSYHNFETERDVLGAILIIPVFRFVQAGMPVLTETTLVWLLVVYAPFLLGLAWYLWSNPSLDIGWIGRPFTFALYLPIVLALGFLLATVEFQIIQAEALIPLWEPQEVLILAVIMFGLVSLTEELIFRGILQRVITDRFGAPSGVAIASLLYGVVHSVYGSLPEIGFAIAVGLILGSIYHVTEGLTLVVIVHGLVNVLVFGMFPLLGPLLVL